MSVCRRSSTVQAAQTSHVKALHSLPTTPAARIHEWKIYNLHFILRYIICHHHRQTSSAASDRYYIQNWLHNDGDDNCIINIAWFVREELSHSTSKACLSHFATAPNPSRVEFFFKRIIRVRLFLERIWCYSPQQHIIFKWRKGLRAVGIFGKSFCVWKVAHTISKGCQMRVIPKMKRV